MRTLKSLAVVLFTGVLLAGCASTRRIAEIQQYPGRFDDDRVTVRGVVTTSWSVPLVPLRFYRVDDGTGEMTVIANEGRVPARGAHVKVRGRVSEFGSFGGRSIGLHLRQEDVDIDWR